jgi:hypothetical protein
MPSTYTEIQTMVFVLLALVVFVVVTFGYVEWRRSLRRQAERDEANRILDEKRRDEDIARAQQAAAEQRKMEDRKASLESERMALDRELADRNARAQREAADRAAAAQREVIAAANSGAGSGGYIVIDMSEKDRPLFHDLLRGFEDYAKLKGYSIAFSIDATFVDRIAFKFTVKDEGFPVGAERVKQDLTEYIQHFRDGDIDDLEESSFFGGFSTPESKHLFNLLKDQMQYMKARYAISQKTIKQYQNFFDSLGSFPALSAPSVIVQTGGNMETRHQLDSRSYSATNSRNILQADNSTLADNSINIGKSFNDKRERIIALDDVIAKLKAVEDPALARAELNLTKVRDELADEGEPSESSIMKWLETAKNVMASVVLGHELAERVHNLFRLFGMQ